MPVSKVGRKPTAQELVNPAKTALVIVDMQNDFCMPGGVCATIGDDLTPMTEVLSGVEKLLCAAREANVLTIFIQSNYDPIVRGAPGSDQAARRGYTKGICITGTPGIEFCPQARPLFAPNEIVVRKHRYSAFWGSDIDLILRSNGIDTVVLAGVTTECCVESTGRDAFFRDYFVVTVEDCVTAFSAERHHAALRVISQLFGSLMSSDALIGHWRAHRANSQSRYDVPLDERLSAIRSRSRCGGEAALLLVNFQNEFCSDDGLLATCGAGIGRIKECIHRARKLVEAARRTDLLVLHSKLETHALTINHGTPVCVGRGDTASLAALASVSDGPARPVCVAESPGSEFVPELSPLPGERVFTARRFSAFADTSLDMIVGANDIDHLLIAGITTEGAIEATAREALDRDYRITLVEDCVASFDGRADAHADAMNAIVGLCGPAKSSAGISASWAPQGAQG